MCSASTELFTNPLDNALVIFNLSSTDLSTADVDKVDGAQYLRRLERALISANALSRFKLCCLMCYNLVPASFVDV